MNVAILTNFQDLNPGYSLTGIVADQVEMLAKYGHRVHLLVNERYNPKNDFLITDRPGIKKRNFSIAQVIPFGDLTDYTSMISWSKEHQYLSVKVSDVLTEYFDEHKIDIAFTHDWIFTGWNLPYAGGIRFTTYLRPQVGWFHWVHSVPSTMRDWWNLGVYGPQHKIIFPNITDQRRVAEQFKTLEVNVFTIPHIKDMRTWFNMCDGARDIIERMPGLMQSQFVQVYPASSDRLEAKGLDYVIKIFASWKKTGQSVCLLVANQWATGRQRKEDLGKYLKLAKDAGLEPDKEFAFTSEMKSNWATGISTNILRDLQQLSNVFIFPTREESFGLVGPEACFAGVVPVFNASLSMMREVYGNQGLYFDFGSFHNNFTPAQDWDKYLEAVAAIIQHRMEADSSVMAKTFCRRKYNMDYLYLRIYKAAMAAMVQFSRTCSRTPQEMNEVSEAIKQFREQW